MCGLCAFGTPFGLVVKGNQGEIAFLGFRFNILRRSKLPIPGEHVVDLRPMLSTDFRDKEPDVDGFTRGGHVAGSIKVTGMPVNSSEA